MTSPELETSCKEINGGASIGATVQFINLAKVGRASLYGHKQDRCSGSTGQTAIDLSTIARFNRFFGETPIKLFDGVNSFQRFRYLPWDERLLYRGTPGVFVYDEANKTLYLNGTIQFAGTLYIKDSPEITDDDSSSWSFPSWAHPLLGFSVAINKGGVDYDDIRAHGARTTGSGNRNPETLRRLG